MPLLRCRFPRGEDPPPTDESEGIREPRPRRRNRGNRGEQDHGDPELPSSTVQSLPGRVGPANRTKSAPISTGPFPTWDDGQQLLQVLLTRKSGSESWQRRGDGSRGPTGGQPPSLISWTRGFLCCGLTEILSEWKVGSVSECTARL